jgi:hypothetical protein
MQQEMQPDYPLLYGIAGFRYCDLLLAAPERAAQPLKWSEQNRVDILSAALDHLTLGRAARCEAILEGRAALPRRLSASASSPVAPAAQQRSPTEDGFATARRDEELADAERAILGSKPPP